MGTVLADDGTTYTTLTAWEATVGTTGGPGGTCTLTGTFDEDGIILDYTNNMLDDPSVEFTYNITGGEIIPATHSDTDAGVLTIVTSTTLNDFKISGITAREADNWINTGIDITLTGEKYASLNRVRVSGLGELGGFDSIGIKCDGQNYKGRNVTLGHCYVTDIRASGGNSAYGISFAYSNRNLVNITNEPSLTANNCTVDSITSQNDAASAKNESFGFNITDASGTTVSSCVSHQISGGNSYIGGTFSVLCFGGDDSLNNEWGSQEPIVRAAVGGNQSSDRTGNYAGIHDEDINDFTGAPGRPDPAAEWKSENEIHDLKIAQGGAGDEVTINGVYSHNNIGAFGTYRTIYVGSDRVGDDDYSTLTSALIGARTNPTYSYTGPLGSYGIPYLLGTDNYPHSGSTWAVFVLSGGEFTEQIKGGLSFGSGPPYVYWAGNVFTGGSAGARAVFRPGHEGYGDSLLDFGIDPAQQPTELIVQHIEVNMENNRWSYGIKALSTSSETQNTLVHDCIVRGQGYYSGSTITESVEVGIAADVVTTSLVYGKINDGIHANRAYNNTVVLDNMSLTGKGIAGNFSLKNNLVLTSGTNFSKTDGSALGFDSVGGSGNISDSRTQVNNYFTDAANDDYTLKLNSHALDSGVVPTVGTDYGAFLPIWPYSLISSTGVLGYRAMDSSHWFIDGGGEGAGDNRFKIDVAVSGFDTGWDERYGQRTEAQPPFIAFMDF